MTEQIKRFFPFLLLLSGLLVIFFGISVWEDDSKGLVSGTIKAREVPLILESGGQIEAVYAAEGQAVKAGDVLIEIEDAVLSAEYNRAAAELAQAEANYALLASKPWQEERMAAIANAELKVLLAQQARSRLIQDADLSLAEAKKRLEENEQALEDLLNPSLQQALAKENIAAAEKTRDSARKHVTILTKPASQAAIDQAYANLLLAEETLNQTQEDLEWAKEKLQGNLGPEVPKAYYIDQYKAEYRQAVQALEIKRSREQMAYDRALQRYNALFEPPDPVELALAEAALAMAEAQLEQVHREYKRVANGPSSADVAVLDALIEAAERDVQALKDGPPMEELAIAEARLNQAEANLALARVDTRYEELAVASARVEAARAALAVVQIQLEKLIVTAPFDGIILDSRVDAGETVRPGTIGFTLTPTHQLTITVFLAREHYHEINQSDELTIQVDAYPNIDFNAIVIQKSNQETFLPRNTARNDNGSNEIFEVQITVEDPLGLIKPGMMAHLDTHFKESAND